MAVGPVLDRTLAAVQDMDLTEFYATTVAPFDEETLRDTVANASPNVILVEPSYEGALVQDIASALQAIPMQVQAIGVPLRVLKRDGPPERHDKKLELTAEGIRVRIT